MASSRRIGDSDIAIERRADPQQTEAKAVVVLGPADWRDTGGRDRRGLGPRVGAATQATCRPRQPTYGPKGSGDCSPRGYGFAGRPRAPPVRRATHDVRRRARRGRVLVGQGPDSAQGCRGFKVLALDGGDQLIGIDRLVALSNRRFGKLSKGREQGLFLLLKVGLQFNPELAEFVGYAKQLRMLGPVGRGDPIRHLDQPWQFPAQQLMVLGDDVVDQLVDCRPGSAEVKVFAIGLLSGIELPDHFVDIEPDLCARLVERYANTATEINAQSSEGSCSRWSLGHPPSDGDVLVQACQGPPPSAIRGPLARRRAFGTARRSRYREPGFLSMGRRGDGSRRGRFPPPTTGQQSEWFRSNAQSCHSP